MAENENDELENKTSSEMQENGKLKNDGQSIYSEDLTGEDVDEDIVSEFLGTLDDCGGSSSLCGGHVHIKWEWLTDEEKKYNFKIYAEIVMDIGTQNRILHSIQRRLLCLTENNLCPTMCEQREIRGLQCCIKIENERLKCYMKRAMHFLADSPCGPWDDIPIPVAGSNECSSTELCVTIGDRICEAMLKRKNMCKEV